MDQPHFLLIPYSEVGHLNPMLSLAARLAALGCKVTFVTFDREGQQPAAATGKSSKASGTDAATENSDGVLVKAGGPAPSQYLDNLRFVMLPVAKDSAAPRAIVRFEVLKKKMQSIDDHRDFFVKLIEDSMASPHPISCIIHECFHLRWVRDVVKAYGLRSALLAPCSALNFLGLYIACTDRGSEFESVCESAFGITREMTYEANGLISRTRTPEEQLEMGIYYVTTFRGIEDAGPFLLNSFTELEAPLLPIIQALGIETSFIGPCLPPWNLQDAGNIWSQLSQQAGMPYTEDHACLAWLDKQEKGSVLYVSFGSEANMEENQVEEIARGITESGYNFLWVVRVDGLSSNMPSTRASGGGEEEKGMVVSWAPQRRVLRHPSVGGFLTHCGWTSILEAVDAGVPLLCLPLQGDQPMNASFVCSYLQVGVQLRISQEGFIHHKDVSDGIHAIRRGQFSERLSKLREASRLASTRATDEELSAFVQANKPPTTATSATSDEVPL